MTFPRGLLSIVSAFLLFSTGTLSGQGYRINIQLEGLSNDTVILGEYFTSRMVPKDTIVVDGTGKGVFEGKTPLIGGLYLVYFSSTHYFDLLLGDDQELSILADTSDFAKSIEFIDSEDNRVFKEYKDFLQQKRGELQQKQALLASAASLADTTEIRDQQKKINSEMEAYMDRVEAEYADLFVSDFIGATGEH